MTILHGLSGAAQRENLHCDPAPNTQKMQNNIKQFDYIVLGSGIAGLTFALKVAPRGRVAIITKKNRAESNTNSAQGGIAAVTSKEDSFEIHVQDTLQAG